MALALKELTVQWVRRTESSYWDKGNTKADKATKDVGTQRAERQTLPEGLGKTALKR